MESRKKLLIDQPHHPQMFLLLSLGFLRLSCQCRNHHNHRNRNRHYQYHSNAAPQPPPPHLRPPTPTAAPAAATTPDGSAAETERMRITSAGKIGINEDDPDGDLQVTTTGSANGELKVGGSESTANGMKITYSNSGNTSAIFKLNYHATNAGALMQFDSGLFYFRTGTSPTTALTLDASQNATFAGSVTDSKGNLRSIPSAAKSSAHTLVAADAGKVIYTSSGGVTVPNSVLSAGDAVTIINNSGSDQTITQGSGVTLYNTADASTGNRTLAGRGMATIWFASASVGYIGGAGLS